MIAGRFRTRMTSARPDNISDAASAATAAPIIDFDGVSFAFDDLVVLDNLSFRIPKGSMRFLLGPSGSGKSVLLKLILGLLRPDSGTITVNGHRIDALPEEELLGIRGDIGMVFQEIALFDSLNVEQNVGYRLSEEAGLPADEVRTRVQEVLGFIGLADYMHRMPSELSGGQRRRVAVARAMASRPNLLLFDDPTTGLDPITSISVNDEIVKLRDLEDVTAIFATHQIRDAFYIATHEARRTSSGVEIVEAESKVTHAEFIVLHEGRFVFEGRASDLLNSPDPYLKEFLFNTLPPW